MTRRQPNNYLGVKHSNKKRCRSYEAFSRNQKAKGLGVVSNKKGDMKGREEKRLEKNTGPITGKALLIYLFCIQ